MQREVKFSTSKKPSTDNITRTRLYIHAYNVKLNESSIFIQARGEKIYFCFALMFSALLSESDVCIS